MAFVAADHYLHVVVWLGAGREPDGQNRLNDRSHAPRGNAAGDAPRSAVDAVTQSVTGCIPTRSVGTIERGQAPSPQ